MKLNTTITTAVTVLTDSYFRDFPNPTEEGAVYRVMADLPFYLGEDLTLSETISVRDMIRDLARTRFLDRT